MKFVVDVFRDDQIAPQGEVIDAGKGGTVRAPVGKQVSLMILAENISVRTLRPKEEGRFDNGREIRVAPNTIFEAWPGSIVILLNYGEKPIRARQIQVDIRKEHAL